MESAMHGEWWVVSYRLGTGQLRMTTWVRDEYAARELCDRLDAGLGELIGIRQLLVGDGDDEGVLYEDLID